MKGYLDHSTMHNLVDCCADSHFDLPTRANNAKKRNASLVYMFSLALLLSLRSHIHARRRDPGNYNKGTARNISSYSTHAKSCIIDLIGKTT